MILTLIAWVYITCVCLIWGNIIMVPFNNRINSTFEEPALPLLCLSGMAAIGILGVWMSVFMPLALTAHIVIIIPALIYLLIPGSRQKLIRQFHTQYRSLSRLQWLIFSTCVLVILFISTYQVKHPDTLVYHAQSIIWMETYRPIPGKVHLNPMLAMSSMWFAVIAIFRFNFIHSHHFLFANGTILCWFCLFLCARIGVAFRKRQENKVDFIPQYLRWVLLLIFCFVSWTQIRLTAASASPDFIVAIYIWAALYSFSKIRSDANIVYTVLSLLFCCAAFTTKMSAVAITLLLIVLLYKAFERRRLIGWLSLLGVVLAIVPCLVRNTIESGYPFFPSAVLSMPGADWKLSANSLYLFQQYITAYARFPVDSYDSAVKAMDLPIIQWVPLWWRTLDPPGKILLVTVFVLLLWNLASLKRQLTRCSFSGLVILAVSLAGTVFWLIKAPSPRFGTCFLIPLAHALSTGIAGNERLRYRLNRPSLYKTVVITFTMVLILYTGYRAIDFFTPSQLLLPQGIKQTAYQEISCEGVKISRSDECGVNPLPCTPDSCSNFTPRGADIFSGFKSKK